MKSSQIIIIGLVALILVALCVIAGILLLRPQQGAEPTPMAVAEVTVPAEATVPPTIESGGDDSWERIQAASKMVVGTSADYPPFESYTGELQIDGFDIALMDEIGRRLGIQIEYRDFAFDGLAATLQVGQIDAAIAAISVTPEREAVVDFSNVYFVGEDAILARGDSSASIGTVADLAGYKVGVQRDTVYQAWVQHTLVDSGQMPADNLLAYEKAEDATRDLNAGWVDLVIMDAQPAVAATSAGSFKLVGRGLNQQRLAIALPEGATSLKAEIDRVLTDLSNEGVIAELAKRYMNLEPEHLLPTPTPPPQPEATSVPVVTATPGPPPSCLDAMAFVKHLTQEGEMKPGQTFTKGWQVKNTGTCTWGTNYRLDFASGQQMGGKAVAVSRQVAPGETYDFQIQMVAPLKAGNHQGIWQMHNAQGQAFGERLKVNVRVVPGPTPKPAPTQTPAAGISFNADRTNIKQGECVTFSWNVQNVKEVYFYAEGERWQDHGVAGQGSQQECPPVNTTYYLRVVKRDNAVDARQIRINVQPSTEAPNITRFTVDPANQITLGQCVTIRWTVEGNIDKITLWYNGSALWEGAPSRGNTQHCPEGTGSASYSLEATAIGGATSRAQNNINVVDGATATPVPTAAPEEPVIYSFSVMPNQIAEGDCVDINWSAGGGAAYIRVLRDGAAIVDQGPLTGHGNDCPAPAGTYTYGLEAYNATGQSVSQQQTVNVSAETPQNPLSDTFWEATVVGPEPVLQGTRLTAAFTSNGQVNGSAGCNTYSANYSVSDSTLLIGPPSATQQVCVEPPFIMDQENAFLRGLSTASSFTLEGGRLRITTDVGTIEFIPVGP
jgi:polar amino acid transport system substrate-binding protein